MIKGTWSLSSELRKNERKQQQKVQTRQNQQHQTEKLQHVDPVRLYRRIQRLENDATRSDRDTVHLERLKQDWDFIEKNKLHHEKVTALLEEAKHESERKQAAATKLWGSRSVYFNPELNPLGKVPLGGANLTVPLKHTTRCPPDPVLAQWDVVLPSGPPPKFYKQVHNINKPTVDTITAQAATMTPTVIRRNPYKKAKVERSCDA